MHFLKCPNEEKILEAVSLQSELPLWRKALLKAHLWTCPSCEALSQKLESQWQSYFQPEPEITSSLLKVYSRLQSDETLILKGWKLGEAPKSRQWNHLLLEKGWLFRGAVSMGLGALVAVLGYSSLVEQSPSHPQARLAQANVPLAQIRVENKNTVRVHYLQPELLQTIEFETTRSR